jgi:hypothetical protein
MIIHETTTRDHEHTCLRFSPDGHTLASVDQVTKVHRLNPATGRDAAPLVVPVQNMLGTMAFSPNGKRIAAGDLGRVSTGDLDQTAVADQGGADGGEGFEVLGDTVVAADQAAVA